MPSIIAARQTPETDRRLGLASAALGVAFVLILFRLWLAVLDRTELSTDEAQYWYFGQELSFGAYSKPPLIGWIIKLSTDLLGQTVWAVRLPAVLIHAATAAVIYFLARRIAPQPVPAFAALLYLVTPGVALGSALMTTDTPLLLCAACGLLFQRWTGEAQIAGKRAPNAAILLGLALGLGLLAKQAMLFCLVGSIAAAMLSPTMRPTRGDALLAVGVMLAVVTPHLVWLYQHRFITLLHVQDISRGVDLSILRPLKFLAEQLLVAGPIFFLALSVSLMRELSANGLAILTLTPLVIVLAQAVKGPVLANWAVLYLVPGSVLVAQRLVRHRWLLGLSLVLGLVVSLALPLVKAFGADLKRPDGRPLLSRYLGHSAIANWALTAASAQGARVLIAQDRDLLADLSWFSVGSHLTIRAVPPQGRPAHHWELAAPFNPAEDARPLLLLRAKTPLPCVDAQEVARLLAPPGFAGGEVLKLFRLPDPACLLSETLEKDFE
jgi:4-amino-4-deoxy-L-arabinose transferase-like glycosyltransferase